jgi:hypothetical protein
VTRLAVVAVVACLVPAWTLAQDRRWEVDVYGGGVAGSAATAGARTLPAAGAPLVTSTPTFPSRETSSWLFGDGAALLNGAAEDLGSTSRIAPLDAIFSPLGARHPSLVGFRLRRHVSARWSAEFSVDTELTKSSPNQFARAIEETRRSFPDAFAGLLATGPFQVTALTASAETDSGGRRESTVTAALNAHWKPWKSFAPYATFGGGLAAGSGSLPSARIEGRYQFSILREVTVSETDSVAIRCERPAAFVAVLGGGARRELSPKWGLAVDARVFIGPDTTRILVDAHPSSVRGTPAGFIESFTNPAIQFSNDPATGRRSTLSGPALEGFDVFDGGLRARTIVTVGLSRRF